MSEIGYASKTVSLPTYKKEKIKMLEKDFMIKLTQEEKNNINEQINETGVDRCSRSIILKHL